MPTVNIKKKGNGDPSKDGTQHMLVCQPNENNPGGLEQQARYQKGVAVQ